MQYTFQEDPNGKHLVRGKRGTVHQHPDTVCIAGGEVFAIDPSTQEPIAVSKLKLRRALRKAGLGAWLNALLKSNPEYAEDWQDASVLMTDDPLLVAVLPAAKAQAGLTDAQIPELLESCRA